MHLLLEHLTVRGAVETAVVFAAVWWAWNHFARHAEEGAHRIAVAADPARVGRGGYAYGHAIMVAGIIVTAVGDELILMHPTGHLSAATLALALLAVIVPVATPMALAICITVVLACVIVVDTRAASDMGVVPS